jgi:hypothetical protein
LLIFIVILTPPECRCPRAHTMVASRSTGITPLLVPPVSAMRDPPPQPGPVSPHPLVCGVVAHPAQT